MFYYDLVDLEVLKPDCLQACVFNGLCDACLLSQSTILPSCMHQTHSSSNHWLHEGLKLKLLRLLETN